MTRAHLRLAGAVLALALPLAVVACYSFNALNTVKARYAMDLGCSDDQVTVAEIDSAPGDTVHQRYRAVGCGRRATYACAPRSAGSEEWDCVPEEEQDPGTVFGTTEGGEAEPGVRDSSHDAGADAAARDGGAADAASPDLGAPAAADAGPPPDPTAAIRARIQDHAADVLGCTGRSSIGVHASWDAHGVVTWGLPGDLAGHPEESCVRSAIGPLTTAPSAPGDLVELVRR